MVIFLSQTESAPKHFFSEKKKHCLFLTVCKNGQLWEPQHIHCSSTHVKTNTSNCITTHHSNPGSSMEPKVCLTHALQSALFHTTPVPLTTGPVSTITRLLSTSRLISRFSPDKSKPFCRTKCLHAAYHHAEQIHRLIRHTLPSGIHRPSISNLNLTFISTFQYSSIHILVVLCETRWIP
jgi:hypothetical protein